MEEKILTKEMEEQKSIEVIDLKKEMAKDTKNDKEVEKVLEDKKLELSDEIPEKLISTYERERYLNSRYTSKNLSWLEFNQRIISMSEDLNKPILERLKFLSISASNLDEFIMVRYGSLLNKLDNIEDTITKYGISMRSEEKIVLHKLNNMKKRLESIFDNIKKELVDKHSIEIINKYPKGSKTVKKNVEKIFKDYIYSAITPIVFDQSRPFPFIKSNNNYIGVIIQDDITNSKVIGTIQIPNIKYRYFEIKGDDNKLYLMSIEDIILNNLSKLFINKNIISSCVFRLLRNSDIEVNTIDNDVFLTEEMKKTLRERELGEPVMLEITKHVNNSKSDNKAYKELTKVITKALDLNKNFVCKMSIVDISSVSKMKLKHIVLEDEIKFKPQIGESFIGERDIFSLIDKQDIVLHHPYESYDHVIQMIEQAAKDPDVLTIKQTLYRVSSKSPIIDALMKAAKSGKQVICLLEIKARFNEEENLNWASKLETAGCHIIYGVDNLKTHCKMTYIVRNSKKGLKTYCHLSTGNYNEITSKIYTDISYFTSDDKICNDVSKLFNTLTGFSEPRLKKIISAPHNMRNELISLIDKEIQASKDGKPCGINLKCNSIDDIEIIDKIYEASLAGVKVNIVVRGICCLRSCQEYSKNVTVKSVVGKFLEHSRIYSFISSNKIYIGSADLMERNLSRRFELLTPILDKECKEKVKNILNVFINDESAYILEDRTYKRLEGSVSSQDIFMNEARDVNKFKNINKIFIRKRK